MRILLTSLLIAASFTIFGQGSPTKLIVRFNTITEKLQTYKGGSWEDLDFLTSATNKGVIDSVYIASDTLWIDENGALWSIPVDSLGGGGADDGNGIYSGSGTVSDSITVNFSGNGVRFDSVGQYGLFITDGTATTDHNFLGNIRTKKTFTTTALLPAPRNASFESFVNPTGNSSTYYNALYAAVETASGYTGNLTGGLEDPGLITSQFNAHHKGSGTVKAQGIRLRVNNEGTGTLSDGMNIYIAGGKNIGGGTYTTEYGLYIADETQAGTFYGIYDTYGYNYFRSPTGRNIDFRYADDDVSHPFTSIISSNITARMTAANSVAGGFNFLSYVDSTGAVDAGIKFTSHIGEFSVDANRPAITFQGWKWNGATNRTAMTGTDNIISVEAGTSRVFAVAANGAISRDNSKGSVSTSTDGSGDVTVTHGMGATPDNIQVTITGTTPYVATVHTVGATQFKVRFYDMAGAAVTSTAVTFYWVGEL